MTWRELQDLATDLLGQVSPTCDHILLDRVSLDAEGTLRVYGRNSRTRRTYSETVHQADVASPYTWACLGDGTPCVLAQDCRIVVRDLLGALVPDPTLKTDWVVA